MRRMQTLLLLAAAFATHPAEEVRIAAMDAAALGPQARQVRWLSYGHLEDPPRALAALRLAVNSVSRNRLIVELDVLPITESGVKLVRLDLWLLAGQDAKDFQELAALWDRLAERDATYHLRTEVLDERRQGAGIRGQALTSTVTVDGGWIAPQDARSLAEATGSRGAVLRLDYFVSAIAATEVSAEAGYYQWADVPAKIADLFAKLGVNRKLISAEAADSAANLFASDVGGFSRRIVVLPTIHGRLYLTKDAIAGGGDRSAIRNPVDVRGGELGDQVYRFDASEIFYTRPNGTWGTALYDAAGNRQDVAPPPLVDTTAAVGHTQIRPLISCLRCHERAGTPEKPAAGLQPFADAQHRLPIDDRYQPEVAQRIRELYQFQDRIGRGMDRDREDFSTAVRAATGLDTLAATEALAAIYRGYVYDRVDVAQAARECGVDAASFRETAGRSTDPVLLGLAVGAEVTRDDWNDSFSQAMQELPK